MTKSGRNRVNGNDRGMKVCILRLLPFPFTGPKTFCAGPNFLSQPKNLTAFSASSSSGYGQRPKFVRDKNSATAEGENFGPTLFFSGTSINYDHFYLSGLGDGLNNCRGK